MMFLMQWGAEVSCLALLALYRDFFGFPESIEFTIVCMVDGKILFFFFFFFCNFAW